MQMIHTNEQMIVEKEIKNRFYSVSYLILIRLICLLRIHIP